MSKPQKEDDLLAERIEEAYKSNRHGSGSPRVHAERPRARDEMLA